MRGFAALSLIFAASAVLLCAQSGLPDSAFKAVPFEQWFQENTAPHISWNASVADATLSTHQRLFSRVDFKVDGKELVRRRGKGRFVFLIQLKDDSGAIWQYHSSIDLERVPDSAASNDYQYMQPFFVLPGNYAVSLAIFDTTTGEHGVAKRRLHVADLKSDPLRDTWRDLPAVEFLVPQGVPDTWYLPQIRGRLHLPVTTRRPARISLVVNLTPSERLTGSGQMQNLNLAVLIPALKVLSQVEWSNAQVDLELLDLVRNEVIYSQDNMKRLSWRGVKAALTETSPGIVDVKSLEKHKYSANFFTGEIGKKLAEPPVAGQAHAVIVLSSSVSFATEVELHQVEATLAADQKVFYLRYRMPRPIAQPGAVPGAGGRRGSGIAFEANPLPVSLPPEPDQLEPLLKVLNPQLFDVTTAEQFRTALAGILAGVSAL